MAFQATSAADAPPGIAAPMAAAPTDLNQLMHLLHVQMQQQQAAQQHQLQHQLVQQQQVGDMMKHMLSMQNASLPSVAPPANQQVR